MDKEPSSKGMTVGLSALCALVLGLWRESFEGFAAGAILGALFAQISYLRKRTRDLSEEVRQLRTSGLESRESAVETRESPSGAGPGEADESSRPIRPTAASAQAAAAQPRPASEGAAAASSQSQVSSLDQQPLTRAPRQPIARSALDRAMAAGVAWLKGGNPLARAGLAVLFVGAAFLAQYAAEHSVFPIELRFLALALGAFALLFIGWRLRSSRAVYAQLLQGGGVAGLYLTIFAATKLYDLLPAALAFALMILIALAAAVLAVAQNALALAVIGTAGGFVAPILVSTGSGNHVALFSYYTILNVGVFAVAWFRTWRVLNVLGFVFTFTITGLWRAGGYERAELFSADFFLILFFVMYVAVSVLNSVRQPPDLKGYVSGSLVFGLPVAAFTLHATLVAHIRYALAWSALTLGLFYLTLGWTLLRVRRASFRLLVEAFAALGVVFASLAVPLAFDTRTTAAMWAVEGAGLLWLGVRQERRLARVFGALLQAGAGLGYLADLPGSRTQIAVAVLNAACLGALMLGVSGVFSGYWLFRHRERQAAYEIGAQRIFTLWGVAWWLFAGLREIAHFLPERQLGASLMFSAATAMLLAGLAANRTWALPRMIAVYLPAVAIGAALLHASAGSHPLAQWGSLGWVAIFAAHFSLLRLTESDALAGRAWLHAGAAWSLALLIAWESSWRIAKGTAGVWASLPWGLTPALMLAWFGRRTPAPRWPLAQHASTYRLLTAAPLAVATALWIAIVNLSSRGEATWLPYLPLLNPLDVTVALCFAAGALWWTSLVTQERATLWRLDPRTLAAVAAALAFVWLNAALIRSLHHLWGAPITWYGVAHSTLVQSAVSIFWGVLGFTAMTIAARQRWRYVWYVGAGLMAVVVAKLFLVDLSNVGAIARIASFLSVGALLLITGYLAPLPPRRELEHSPA
ncbi:MAG TPA: DUF2339 domain-containing protein [Steroidobacter sp.]|nr:DUF2339 domain-containing protein [Steroidobacter sp.]